MLEGISIVVPAHNEEKYIRLCIEELIKQCKAAPFATEIIVVNNNSQDDTKKIAESYPIEVLDSSATNPAGVRNAGAAKAKFSFLAFIDGDCVACDGWLEDIFKQLSSENVGAYGGPHIAPTDQNWIVSNWNPRVLKDSISQRAKLPGSNFSISHQLFNRLDGFNEQLTSAEDDDLSKRAAEQSLCVKDSKHYVEHYGYPDSLIKVLRQQIWHGSTQLKAHGPVKDKVTLLTLIWLLIPLVSGLLTLIENSALLQLSATLLAFGFISIPLMFTLNKLKQMKRLSLKQNNICLPYWLGPIQLVELLV